MKKGSDMDAKETTEREVGRRLPYSDPLAPITSCRCDCALRNQGNEGEICRQQHHRFSDRVEAWVNRKIFLYNVATGLYVLDWWERYLFNTLLLLLLWFVCYNSFHFAVQCFEGTMQVYQGWGLSWPKIRAITANRTKGNL